MDEPLGHLTADSRAVRPGSLFVAIRGEQADGHAFLDNAVKHGAIAVLREAAPAGSDPDGVASPQPATDSFDYVAFDVTSTRAALAEAAALLYGDPSREIALVGVTGTNGKTTTTFLLHHVFQALGHRAGLIGTVETRLGDAVRESTHTTPSPDALQALLREMVAAGCTHAAMEVSSHALHQQRVRGVRFSAGVFTNLTRDHLDYHPTFEHYARSKRRLFDGLDRDAVAITNADDETGVRMTARTKARRVTYGQAERADVRFRIAANTLAGLVLEMGGRTQRYRLVGGFNAYNLAAAFATATGLGLDGGAVLDALATAPPVPGRFEQFQTAQGRTVVVDYAHTPDALDNVLRTMRETMPEGAALWVVFGCGGDRDAGKRPVMGQVAAQHADHVVLTSDNPRTEDPGKILADIAAGMDAPPEAQIVDRAEALAYVAQRAAPGDAVLVAGKGHEPYQILGTEKRHFDDRERVQRLFGGPGG
jgi:UDP-N-acetylmuramoyl-L-alanyl-D-glutamate--2,6-diaminopimelate ligase